MGLNGTNGGNGNGNGYAAGANVSFTKFLFVRHANDDDHAGGRMRTIGGLIGRGFFNEFDSEATRDSHETIHFLVRAGDPSAADDADRVIAEARHAVQVSSKYRPRLQEIEEELRRRLGDGAEVASLDGAVRAPRYSSAEMHHFMSHEAPPRRSGRVSPHAFILPVRKTRAWWQQGALDRQTYFYPHVNRVSGAHAQGHAMAAAEGIPYLHRRMFHNPDGYQRPGEYDFITYVECDETGVPVFDRICQALRDRVKNPEWAFVEEGPLWRGTRVLRW